MELKKLISNFVAQICEKNYANSGKVLDQVITEKFKKRITDAKEKIESKDGKCECEKNHDKKSRGKNKKKTKKVAKKVTKKG